MLDQAEALRNLVRDRLTRRGPVSGRPRIHTIAVTSGKGGVGKTSIAVNLALLLARNGRQVRLVDADFGLANAEVLLGVKPRYTLRDVLDSRMDAGEAWADAPGGLKLLSSGSGLEDMANMGGAVGLTLVDHMLSSVSDGETIVIDTGPGIDESVVSLLAFADEVLMVTTPEPTSVADTYAAIKVLLSRAPDADITLLPNCCTSPAQASAIAGGIDSVCRRFLSGSFARHEYLPSDAAVGWAIRARKPLVLSGSQGPITPWLRKLSIRLDERMRARGPRVAAEVAKAASRTAHAMLDPVLSGAGG